MHRNQISHERCLKKSKKNINIYGQAVYFRITILCISNNPLGFYWIEKQICFVFFLSKVKKKHLSKQANHTHKKI